MREIDLTCVGKRYLDIYLTFLLSPLAIISWKSINRICFNNKIIFCLLQKNEKLFRACLSPSPIKLQTVPMYDLHSYRHSHDIYGFKYVIENLKKG